MTIKISETLFDFSSGGDYKQVLSILSDVSQFLSTQSLVDKFEQLILTHYIDFDRIMPSLRLKLELAKYEMNWYKRNSHKIVSWIRTRNSPDFKSSVYFL